nr:methyl-accepting chemotaxis protein [Halomonas campisalis]
MTVRLSWSLVLVFFAGMLVLLSGLGVYAVSQGQEALRLLNEVNVDQQSTLNRANAQMLSTRLELQQIHDAQLDARNRQALRESVEQAEAVAGQLDAIQATIEAFAAMPTQPAHESMVERISASATALISEALRPQQATLVDNDTDGFAELNSQAAALNERFNAAAADYFEAAQAFGAAHHTDYSQVANLLKLAIFAVLLGSALVMVIAMWGITVNVLKPLARLVNYFEGVAKGDLSHPVEKRGNNEIGRLFTSLSHMQEGLSGTVGTVRRSSEGIYHGAQDIAQGNNELSSRTEQQAASLAETASSMEQLASTVEQNADNARQATQLSAEASRTAEQGGEVVGEVVTTMHEISASSHKMSDIIGVIDTIAFQTNILALNASVEAARAGEHGRGFAVVAQEVRNLAGRSASAAGEIRELIQASLSKVDAGTSRVDLAGQTMSEIVAAVQRVSDIMDEIASASQEQSNGIGQVNQAVTQMDQVTQQNAALVQQAASAAVQLEAEAGHLREAVLRFRLAGQDDAGSGDGAGDTVSSSSAGGQDRMAGRSLAPVTDPRPGSAHPGATSRQGHSSADNRGQRHGESRRGEASEEEWASF